MPCDGSIRPCAHFRATRQSISRRSLQDSVRRQVPEARVNTVCLLSHNPAWDGVSMDQATKLTGWGRPEAAPSGRHSSACPSPS